jgi:lipid-binding SYLF domain-containing protein
MPTLECAGQPSAPSSAVEGIQMKTILPIAGILRLAALVLVLLSGSVFGADRVALERDARAALQKLTAAVPAAKALSGSATAVLVFPKITKAGLGIGGQYGDGVLFKGGKVAGYYNTSGASYGLQAGAQRFGYAMFLMNDKAVSALGANDGFEVGVGPSVVVMDEGKAKTLTTTTAKDDIYAFIFGQKGLMAGVGLQGNKITRLKD